MRAYTVRGRGRVREVMKAVRAYTVRGRGRVREVMKAVRAYTVRCKGLGKGGHEGGARLQLGVGVGVG